MPKDVQCLQDAFSSVNSLYIADGHHRTAAACRFNSDPGLIKKNSILANSSK